MVFKGKLNQFLLNHWEIEISQKLEIWNIWETDIQLSDLGKFIANWTVEIHSAIRFGEEERGSLTYLVFQKN